MSWIFDEAIGKLDLQRGGNDREEREGPYVGFFFFFSLIEPPWLLIIGANGIRHCWNRTNKFHFQWLGLKFNNGGGVW